MLKVGSSLPPRTSMRLPCPRSMSLRSSFFSQACSLRAVNHRNRRFTLTLRKATSSVCSRRGRGRVNAQPRIHLEGVDRCVSVWFSLRWPRKLPFLLRYLAQVSLIIFRLVTRRSPYSSFSDAFTTSPSFFSFFASPFDSPLAVPVTDTLWPT